MMEVGPGEKLIFKQMRGEKKSFSMEGCMQRQQQNLVTK